MDQILDPKTMASLMQNMGPIAGGLVQARQQQLQQPQMPMEQPEMPPRLRPGRDDPQYAQERYTAPMQPVQQQQQPGLTAQPLAQVGQPAQASAAQLMALQQLYGGR